MRGARPRGRVSRTRGGSPPGAMGRRSGTEARWWQRPEGPPRPGGAGREGARRREAPRPCARRLGLRGPRGLAGAAAASRARTAARCPRRGRQGLREGRRRGSPPRSERQRGADAEPGSSRVARAGSGAERAEAAAARDTGLGARRSTPRSRELPSADCRCATCTWGGSEIPAGSGPQRLLYGGPSSPPA